MMFALYYVAALGVLVAHFSGTLARRNLTWTLYVLAVTVFPAMLYL